MKKESILIAVFALLAGLLGGTLITLLVKDKSSQQVAPAIPSGSGSPTDYARRIAEAEKIVAMEPGNLNAWISLGNDYFDTEQAQKAINAYQKALEIEPNNPNILTDQGIMYRKVGWYDKALANFEKAQKLDPKHLQSLYNMGVVYAADLKQPDKAISVWNRYLELDNTSPTAKQIREMMASLKPASTHPAKK
jgi:cytochrome c-type biogenesis protein CcmH/NrfG